MVFISSLNELMEDQMLQYCQIVLNINDRAFTHRNIYHIILSYIVVSVTLVFMLSVIVRHTHTHTHTYIYKMEVFVM